VAEGHSTPTTWNVETGENIKWKTAIPGLAHSSPIVWGDRLFVTTAVSTDSNPVLKVGLYGESPINEEKVDHDYRLLCLDKNTGKVLWDKSTYKGVPKVMRHIKATHADCTPATDGKYVIAFFGSEGLYCYDFDGDLIWKREFGMLDAGPPGANELQWGFSSSPVIHDGKVILFISVRNDSYLAALDVRDGKEIWKTPREPDPCWATPTVDAGGDQGGSAPSGRSQVIVNGYQRIGGYDLATGKELWWMKGHGDIPVPTPIVHDGLIDITNAHGGKSPVYAIRTTAEGDLTFGHEEGTAAAPSSPPGPHIAWAHLNIGNYMQTPLVYGDYIYLCRDQGIMACYDALTGKKVYRERLAEGIGWTASPVAADGKVYFTNEEGGVHVIKAGPSYEVLAKNSLGEITMSTPAVSDGVLYFRTVKNVIAVGGN
jgi:outer membrane protein assembly factor BamB